MAEILGNYLGRVKIGRKQSYKNLEVFPLLGAAGGRLNYLLLDEALDEKWVDIIEIDEGGSVPDLKVKNRADRMLLLIDGEELVGAKQNRIINTTILIAANTTVLIPVSCVEQGRWDYKSEKFYSEKRVMSPSMRARKAGQVHQSLRMRGESRADQGAIWDAVDEKAMRMEAPSPTMAMEEMYKKNVGSLKDYQKHFRLATGQVGAIFMINGEVVGLDSFGRPDTFAKVFAKMIESYALDALDWFDPEIQKKALKKDAAAFVDKVLTAKQEPHKPVALGTDLRIESETVTGFALSYEAEILHLSAFKRDNGNRKGSGASRISRFSSRRRNRI